MMWGSGTGSVSVECARLSPDIAVFAIEQKEEAANLTKENAVRLGLSDQIMVINKRHLKDLKSFRHRLMYL